MSKKLAHLISFVLVLGLSGVAQGVFDTVGVYDPDDAPHHNQVDQSGVYDSHTGNAGPENVIDLATFQELIGAAFQADGGGVVDIEIGDFDGQNLIANFGTSGTKSVTFTNTSGIINVGSSVKNNRRPISGSNRLAKSDTSDFVFDIGPVTGGAQGEVVTYFAGTLLDREGTNLAPSVTATFSGGGTVTATAVMDGSLPINDQDAFFGFVAPAGESIVNVNFDLSGYSNLDDVAFITSAFTVSSAQASDPRPANKETDVPRDAVLSWKPGEFAAPTNGHKVYFGESFNDVNDATGGVAQDANSYTPPQRLDFGTTYYWRVDEVNAPPTSHIEFKGEVWQFTTEPVAYPIAGENITATASSTSQEDMGPENTINGSGLDANDLHSTEATDMWLSGEEKEPNRAWIEYELDKVYKLHQMWVWNSNQVMEPMIGLGFKDVSIEYSVNGMDYTILGTTHEFARASGASDYAYNTTVDFGGVAVKYVRLTANSNWGGFLDQYGLSEVRFLYIPLRAREPQPDSGTTDVAVDVTLSLRAGREAAEHDVYLSTDEQAVIDGNAPVTTVTETSYGPLSLDLGTTYYWKINEVNEAETTTTWQGDIWNFSTHEFFVVDGFEDYNDWPPDEIWATWIDGYGVLTNGATVGYPVPDWGAGEHYVETTIVHGGSQSMPFFYDNTGTATYSEGERTFAVPQDWTKAGVQTLVLHFLGDPNNAVEQMYVKLNGSKVVYDGDAADITQAWWHQWNIDLASFGVDLQNVTTLAIGIDGSGASGTLYLDDIRLYRLAPEPPVGIWLEAELADIIGASWRIYDDPASSGGRHIGSENGDGNDGDTAPGAEWVAVYNFDAAGGTYKVLLRAQEFGSDSFWVRIPGAASQTHEDPDQPGTGWVRFNGIDAPDGWAWDEVHSDDHNREVVNWTLPAGPHTLEIAKREDGVLLDAIVITDDVD